MSSPYVITQVRRITRSLGRLVWRKATNVTPAVQWRRNRPDHVTLRYELVLDQEAVAKTFEDLRRRVFELTENHLPVVLREAGHLDGKRRYFYIQELNNAGWLFERSECGWMISQADKVVGTGTFMRSLEPWDVATVVSSKPGLKGYLRVASTRFGDTLSLIYYQTQLMRAVLVRQR